MKTFLSLIFAFTICLCNAQDVSFTRIAKNGSASGYLKVEKGIIAANLTAAERTSILLPSTGLTVYQTDGTAGFYYYNGSAWVTLSSSSAGIISGANGGTGVANTGKTITLGGNLVTSGAYAVTLTATGTTSITLPTSGSLVTDAVATLSSLTSIGILTALDVNADLIRVRTAKTPASAGATGSVGQICWDSGFIYVCVATNTWKKIAISTW